MNLLKLSFFLVLIFAVSACKDDDDATVCTQSDWVGIYDGTIVCDGVSEDGTVTITASGSNAIIIFYEAGLTTVEYDPITPKNCDIDLNASAGGDSQVIDANLDGDKFTLTDMTTFGGVSETCIVTATRK